MKGLGIGNKLLQQNIVDLFPDSLTDPDRWSLHGEWTYTHTHTHTHARTHTHINTHIYIYILYIYTYVYIYIYTHTHYTQTLNMLHQKLPKKVRWEKENRQYI